MLTPLVAAALLHTSLSRLSDEPTTPLPSNWDIEDPLVLESTPIRYLPGRYPLPTDSIKALSALSTSHRNLVQLFTLCSFVLLVHLARSLHQEKKQARAQSALESVAMEREQSGPGSVGVSNYWLKLGEWKRTRSVFGFAFLVTVCCLGVKIVTALIGHGVWSGEPSSLAFRQSAALILQ